jgi:hypothetical protein
MIDFDPAPLIYLGESLSRVEKVQAGVLLAFVMWDIHEARQTIQGFTGDHQNKVLFSETVANLGDVLVWLNTILPPSERPHQDYVITDAESSELLSSISSIYTTFQNESKRQYLCGLHNQRGYEPSILIEKFEEIFSPECWSSLSTFTKRELKEAGRCLAFERYTAAAFHALRALEAEIRDYACLVLRGHPKKRDLGYMIDEVLAKNGADPKLISALGEIRRLERNPLAHPEAWLDLDEAVGTISLSHTALTRTISDMKRQGLLPT